MTATRRVLLVLLAAMLPVAAGCGFDAADFPLPSTRVGGEKYTIRIELSSVLNLPEKAEIVSRGVDVGRLQRVDPAARGAVASVDIEGGTRLPADTRAEIRQSSLLGDTYIALLPPPGPPRRYLRDGDTIPMSNTAAATNIEDMLRGMADVVSSGRYGRFAEMVRSFNAAFPASGQDFARIAAAGRETAAELAAHTDDIDRILDSAEAVTGTLDEHRALVDDTLRFGPERAVGQSEVLFGVVNLLVAVRNLTVPIGGLLLPVAPELRQIIATFTPAILTAAGADITVPETVDRINALLRDRLVPFFSAPPNIRVHPDGDADQLINTLRSIGMLR
ncbi:MlaD family protein [Nocardia wallacei]|uniref:MlaD family protein n=1 Tax=Nocardia wallacei TaxID=480035 RepID=UPI0024549630|nr:MlaD family protein [Nocardia wallacei]